MKMLEINTYVVSCLQSLIRHWFKKYVVGMNFLHNIQLYKLLK